jgi:alpha-tubulin suppressor-like RCC1 family protein
MPFRRLPVLAVALLLACGPDYIIAPTKTGGIVLVSGNGQSGRGGVALASPIVMKVIDTAGAGRAGVQVTWTPETGSGSVAPTVDTSDASGLVSVTWTLGTNIGLQRIHAAAAAVGTNSAAALVPGFAGISLGVGDLFACGIDLHNYAWCWGNNAADIFANGGGAGTDVPQFIPDSTHRYQRVAAGADFACALTTTQGKIWCWGSNAHGQRGVIGTPVTTPNVVAGSQVWTSVVAGGENACAIASDSTAWCWGVNNDGQVGDGTNGTDRSVPAAVTGGHKFLSLAISSTHACGVGADASHTLWCWGRNTERQLGAGLTGALYNAPQAVTGSTTLGIFAVAAGAFHTCAVGAGGTWCWGSQGEGALGDGKIQVGLVSAPKLVDSTHAFLSIAADTGSTSALASDGSAWWWGNRGDQASPTPGVDQFSTPHLVPGGFTWSYLALGAGVTCARAANTYTYCWGHSTDPDFAAGDSAVGVQGP